MVGLRHQQHLRDDRGPAPATSTSRRQRNAAGTDTDDNARDFTLSPGTPEPRRQVVPPTRRPTRPTTERRSPRSRAPAPPARSPGKTVTTERRRDGAYPTGGFNGFYLQTAGTGGDVDPATHQASDAVFVFGSAAAGGGADRRARPGDRQGQRVPGHHRDHAGRRRREGAPGARDGATGVRRTPADGGVPASPSRGCCWLRRGHYTVADNYALNQYGEIGLAAGNSPLFTPTEVADPHDAAAIQAVKDDNAARSVTLDDGATANYLTTAQGHPAAVADPGPPDPRGRPGHASTQPVVLEWRFDIWRFQPTDQLTADDAPAGDLRPHPHRRAGTGRRQRQDRLDERPQLLPDHRRRLRGVGREVHLVQRPRRQPRHREARARDPTASSVRAGRRRTTTSPASRRRS